MMSRRSAALALLLAASVSGFGVTERAHASARVHVQKPDADDAPLVMSDAEIKALLDDAVQNNKRRNKRLFDYTTVMRDTMRRLNDGKLTERVELAEMYPRFGFSARKLLSVNGKPVSDKDLAASERRLGRELEKDEQKRREQAAALERAEFGHGYGGKRDRVYVSIYEFVRAADFTNPRRTIINSRPAILLDFRPRADYKPSSRQVAPIAHLVGQLWIDEADRQFARLEARLSPQASALVAERARDEAKNRRSDNGGSPAPTSADAPLVVMELVRLPDGMWFERRHRINATPAPEIFNGNRVDWERENLDIRRFDTTTDAQKPRAAND